MTYPKIETTIEELLKAEPALRKLATLKLGAKTRYHVAKLLKYVSEETKEHFYDLNKQLLKDLGGKRAPTTEEAARGMGPEILFVPPDKVDEFDAAIRDLISVEVTIPWGPVTMAMIEPVDDFTAADLCVLGPLVDLSDSDDPALPKKTELKAV